MTRLVALILATGQPPHRPHQHPHTAVPAGQAAIGSPTVTCDQPTNGAIDTSRPNVARVWDNQLKPTPSEAAR